MTYPQLPRVFAAALVALLLTACAGGAATGQPTDASPVAGDAAPTATEGRQAGALTVYSGRSEELVGPLLERFTEDTGIDVDVRYADTAELAATILDEGANSPADVYFAQDAGALGALASRSMLAPLPSAITDQVSERFRAPDGSWVGVSGRSRVIVYNTEALTEDAVPDSVVDLTDDEWAGRVGWAPTNGSFQSFVTAMRVELGDEATRQWVEEMVEGGAQVYDNNSAIVEAVGRGEIDLGLVNHYYLGRFLAEDPSYTAANKFLPGGDVGSLVNVAGAGVLTTTDQPEDAQRFVEYLLSRPAQEYFAGETYEYPLVEGVEAADYLPPLETIETPELDLGSLEDLEGTLELLRSAGALT